MVEFINALNQLTMPGAIAFSCAAICFAWVMVTIFSKD